MWDIETNSEAVEWILESYKLAKSFAYSPEIIEAVKASGELQRIALPEEYLEEAGRRARVRIVAAGLQLAPLLQLKR